MAGWGKLARLPSALKDEALRRLHSGEPAARIIADYNSRPDVQAALDQYFGGQKINPANFSRWAKRAYPDWVRRQEQIEQIRERARLATEVARQGRGISDGAATLIASEILDALDGMTDTTLSERMDALRRLVDAVVRVRAGDHEERRIEIEQQRLAHAARALELQREKFQVQTAELVLRYAQDQRAKEIVEKPIDNRDKIEALGRLMFGDSWRAQAAGHETASGSS